MTSDQKGISCDLCGVDYRDKFEYFSGNLDKVFVDSALQKTGIVDCDRRFLDIDICEKCMNEFMDKMKQVITEREKKAVKNKSTKADQWSTGDGAVRSKRSKRKR